MLGDQNIEEPGLEDQDERHSIIKEISNRFQEDYLIYYMKVATTCKTFQIDESRRYYEQEIRMLMLLEIKMLTVQDTGDSED